jgi:AGZA family xanthine/uracil permease-like MFS transporter
VSVGGRSGVTAVTVGLLFLFSLAAVPLLGMVPNAASAPALIVVGSLMMSSVAGIQWDDAAVAIPAFLTLLLIPLTYSIANGIACGFIAFVLIRLFLGRWRDVTWLMYLFAALFMARFIYIGGLG